MKAQPGVYIKLQNIYKAKARQDVAEVLEMVQESPRGRNVDPGDVELFCKNAAFVKLINAGRANGARLTEVARKSPVRSHSFLKFLARELVDLVY